MRPRVLLAQLERGWSSLYMRSICSTFRTLCNADVKSCQGYHVAFFVRLASHFNEFERPPVVFWRNSTAVRHNGFYYPMIWSWLLYCFINLLKMFRPLTSEAKTAARSKSWHNLILPSSKQVSAYRGSPKIYPLNDWLESWIQFELRKPAWLSDGILKEWRLHSAATISYVRSDKWSKYWLA